MTRALLRQVRILAASIQREQKHFRTSILPTTRLTSATSASFSSPSVSSLVLLKFRSFSSSEFETPPLDSGTSVPDVSEVPNESDSLISPDETKSTALVEDVGNADFKALIEKYLHGKDEEALPAIMEAILRRRLSKKHEQTDDELMEELRMRPLNEVTDQDFEDDLEELHETDDEIENLYDTRPYIEKMMMKNEYFNMDDGKWDDMIREATEQGVLKDTTDCEHILEDMLSWDKLLPDEIKQKIEARFNELEDMCERGEVEPEKAYELFKEFEDKMVGECEAMMAAEEHPEELQTDDPEKKIVIGDPPGDGPVLRWQTRVVFAPGGDAWHPKNRKVKLSATLKELGLSRHASRRLKELVGKRYNSGKDELTVTSERFEHREENRKDCLRTLYALIEEAMRADKLAAETRTAFVKSKLRTNAAFMESLRAKVAGGRLSLPA